MSQIPHYKNLYHTELQSVDIQTLNDIFKLLLSPAWQFECAHL